VRATRGSAAALGALLVFAFALPCAVLVHAGAPAVRRLVAAETNRALEGLLRGHVEIRSIRRLGLYGLDDVSATVRDPDGRTVAVIDGVTVRTRLAVLAWAALHGNGELPFLLREVRVRSLDATLVPGPDGEPTLAHDLEPVPPPPGAPARPVRLEIAALRVESARIHGRLGAFEDFAASVSPLEASFEHDDRATAGRVRKMDTTVTGVAPAPVHASMQGDFSLPASGAPHATAQVEARVGELPVTAAATLDGSRIDGELTARATRESLEALAPQLAFLAPALARAEVHGTLTAPHASARVVAPAGTLDATADLDRRGRGDLAASAVDATLDLRVRDVRVEGQEVGRADARARVQGALSSPRVHLSAVAEGVRVAGRPLDRVSVEAEGPVREPAVQALVEGAGLPRIEARASLELGGAPEVRAPVVELTRDGETVVVAADRVRAAQGAVDVTGIEIRSGGEPLRGEAHLRPRGVRVRLSTAGMDLTPLLHVAGAPGLARGSLWLDVDLRADAGGATGRASARLETAGVFGDRPHRARLHLGFAGRRIDGNAELAAGDAKALLTLTRVTLAGPPLEARSWRRATGVVALRSDLPLASLRDLVPQGVSPFDRMDGDLDLRARVSRSAPDALPDVTLDASTRDLVLAVRTAGAPWQLRGVDVRLTAALEGTRDRVAMQGALVDGAGDVARFDVDAQPALREAVRTHARIEPLLERMPLRVRVDVPERDVSTWPAPLRPPALHGRVQADAEMSGALVDPRVRVRASALGVAAMQPGAPLPFDGTLEATYDGRAVIARAIARRPEGVVLDARSDVDVRAADLLAPPAGGVPWDADATLALHGFPLQGVPAIAVRGLGGFASGVVALEGLHRDARIDADLSLLRPRLGAACFDDGWLDLRADGRTFAAGVGLGAPGSSAAASIHASSRWGSALLPAIDMSRRFEAALDAKNFRAGALLPLVRGSVNQLDGRIDANARIRVDPYRQTGTMEGVVRLTGGVVEVPDIGERLHDVTATVSMRPWGTLRFDDITARGSTGRLTASAQVVLDGLTLQRASAEVDIPNEQRMPVTVEGVSLGEASAHLHADATMSPDRSALLVDVKASRLDMRVPQSVGHAVQSLDPAPGVVVGATQPDGRFVPLRMQAPQKSRPPGSMEIRATVDLGDDATLRRDANLQVQLTGTPTAVLDAAPRVDGMVHVVRGWVDVFGRRFAIEPASTISFMGDPDNPQLVITATYESSDGTRIFADLVGPAKKPKIALRSEPARPQDAIVGLLLFGSDEGLVGTPVPALQPDPTQRAAGLAIGPVTEALNKALAGITALDVTTRIDISQANPRPEVDLRVSNDVVARVTLQTGMPAPGELPDRTLLTLDWRFHPRWSLESTVGDEGSTLVDVLWRHRY
jgi:translocation and assembly module TamB